MTHEDFVTFEQAKALKELGFDWECRAVYLFDSSYDNNGFVYGRGFWVMDYNKTDEGYSAPTLYQAQKWLREVKQYHIEIRHYRADGVTKFEMAVGRPAEDDLLHFYSWVSDFRYDTYESALSEGIRKALELLNNNT